MAQTHLQWKIDRKPTDHIRALGVHRHRIRGQFYISIENRLEVSRETVADAAVRAGKCEPCLAHVVAVGDGG